MTFTNLTMGVTRIAHRALPEKFVPSKSKEWKQGLDVTRINLERVIWTNISAFVVKVCNPSMFSDQRKLACKPVLNLKLNTPW